MSTNDGAGAAAPAAAAATATTTATASKVGTGGAGASLTRRLEKIIHGDGRTTGLDPVRCKEASEVKLKSMGHIIEGWCWL